MDTDDDQPLTGERLRDRLGGNGAQAQFIRFAAVGGVANVLYGVVFVLLAGSGSQPADLAGALASSALADELHRRRTFRASGRVTWLRAQWEGGGLAGAGMVATSTALALWDALAPGGGALAHLAVVAVVTGAVGLIRFAALRRVVRARAADSRSDRQQGAPLPVHGSPPAATPGCRQPQAVSCAGSRVRCAMCRGRGGTP